MTFLTVDQDKCKHDGICAAECPSKVIVFRRDDAFPISAKGAERYCIKCGHCMAVCPAGAITVSTLNTKNFVPVNQALLPGTEQVEHFLKARRSIRTFKDKTIHHTILEKLLSIAAYAPSGHNKQPVNWLVIEDKNRVKSIAGFVIEWMRYMIESKPELAASLDMKALCKAWDKGSDQICRDAPHIIIAHAPCAESSSQSACTIALTYLELAAFSLKLGACWAGFVEAAAEGFPPLLEELALPEGNKVYGAMLLGYPQYVYHKIPSRLSAQVNWK
ncbi:MAG: nitroreductase family protein [Syntrophomonadaceae bacterium]|nr:nitroreductase family protein [Syntrophomonadaceae bacterium]